ncbi:LysR family transcriptional regulator [Ramlibacter solisilvae]|uniref:LysR family transcriptional regulator n=1 Tax=Ramlibacter tataouinensis TaxID=94132 RepID=A0A127JQX2_9BURK|nr:LysR family transcriptional regulator [Ramlibacter tataouinensis]AMO22371.1 LysR family transcriptional regulator [Ramlibacter tataouinensis]
MRDLDLTTLRLFVAVCEEGNIARASERANIVGSAISKRLAQLEDQLGTPLLARKRYGVVPTTAGQTLLEHARAILDSATRIQSDMRNFAGGARGQVRVLASVSAMTESLAEDVAAFLSEPEHRAIQVDLEERVSPEIVRGVQEGMASLGVCWDAAELNGLQSRPYRSDHLCVVVPGRHPLAGRRKVRFADTLDYEQVGLPVSSAVQVRLQQIAAGLGRAVRHRVIVTNFEAALRVVRAGLAISVVPREVAQPMAGAYGLKLLALDEPWAERRFIVCFRDAQTLTPSALLLLDYLAQLGAAGKGSSL